MGQVYVTEIPGGDAQAWQCPNCSLAYPMKDDADHTLECPAKCKRCGAPMDIDQALVFANAEAQRVAGTITRPKVRV